jgi:predicted RNA-binding Zn-ribbon protein involved in translation (DUF1610 family)
VTRLLVAPVEEANEEERDGDGGGEDVDQLQVGVHCVSRIHLRVRRREEHAVWRCGGVAVWRCGGVAVWQCGGVAVWRCARSAAHTIDVHEHRARVVLREEGSY